MIRLVIASVWLYEGLWLKVIHQAAHELAVVQSVIPAGPISPQILLLLIGGGETLLGLGVLSGLYYRPLAWFQGLLLIAMNMVGILFGDGSIADPLGLIIHNLPLLLCIAILGTYGPGSFALRRAANRS